METAHSKSRSSSIHFLHGKMFIQTASVLPVIIRIADERQVQQDRGSQIRSWDDDGGAQPMENARAISDRVESDVGEGSPSGDGWVDRPGFSEGRLC